MATNKLTDAQVRRAAPKEKTYRMADGEGLCLYIKPSGTKIWRFDYAIHKTRKTISFGLYPTVGLARARERRLEARRLVAQGVDPSVVRKVARREQAERGHTFEAMAEEFLVAKTTIGPRTRRKLQWLLTAFLYPALRRQPVTTITPPQVLEAVRAIEQRGMIDTAHRARALAAQIFRYAIAHGAATHNPAADLHDALAPLATQHHAALTTPAEVGDLLVAIDAVAGQPPVTYGLRLMPYLFVRSMELRCAQWAEFDLPGGLWRIPGGRMKMKEDHLVPLAPQVVRLLQELQGYSGEMGLVFPGMRRPTIPISENTLNAALSRIGYRPDQMTIHGFRAMARTLLHEQLAMDPSWIEVQLAHVVPGPMGRTYNRALYLPQRIAMMTRWADYLDELRETARRRHRSGAA